MEILIPDKYFMKAHLYRWHRRLGMATFIFVTIWACSGILHPLMVWTGPQPIRFKPPVDSANDKQIKFPLSDVLQKNGISLIEAVRLREFDGRTYYQVRPAGSKEWLFFDVETGVPLASGNSKYAAYLARYYTGERRAPINKIEQIETFGKEFVAFNQLLPVYRVSFGRADGLRAYVDTETGMLGDVMNNWKGALEWAFETFHLIDWLRPIHPMLPTLTAVIFAILTFLGGITGLYFTLLSRPRIAGPAIRRWHRKMGLFISVFLLLVSFSGAVTAAFKFRNRPMHEEIYRPIIAAGDLKTVPRLKDGDEWKIIFWPGHCIYRIMSKSPTGNTSVRYLDGTSGNPTLITDKDYALFLATHFSGLDRSRISSVTLITHFDSEYNFFRRRLPVWRINYDVPGNPRYYVDTACSRLVLQMDNPEEARNLIFAFFHKYNWIDAIAGPSKTTRAVRDLFSVVVTLSIAFVALSGITVLWKTRQR